MVRQFFRKNLFKIDNKPVWPSFRTRWSRSSPWNRARSIGRAHRFLPHRSWLFIAGCRLWNLANVSIQRPLSLLLPPNFPRTNFFFLHSLSVPFLPLLLLLLAASSFIREKFIAYREIYLASAGKIYRGILIEISSRENDSWKSR